MKKLALFAFSILLLVPAGAQNAFAGPPLICAAPDRGDGTVEGPLTACEYFSDPSIPLIISDGLPAGSTIVIDARIFNINGIGVNPGGSLGGETETASPVGLELSMTGTGALTGFNRNLQLPLSAFQLHSAPRTPGDPVQVFDTEMFNVQTALFGDPDFSLFRINIGSFHNLPSPGQTTLTDLGNGDFQVDSFFDVTYQIDFIGATGGALEGLQSTGANQGNTRFNEVDNGSIIPNNDNDNDGIPNDFDQCPNDPNKGLPGLQGCGVPESPLSCGFGTEDNGNGECESIIQCGAGTFLDGNVCTLLEQCEALGSMIGGALMDIDTTALLIASVGVNPVITGLVAITLAGVVGQAVWFVHKRNKKNE